MNKFEQVKVVGAAPRSQCGRGVGGGSHVTYPTMQLSEHTDMTEEITFPFMPAVIEPKNGGRQIQNIVVSICTK